MGFLAGLGASFLAGSAGFLAAQCREYRLPCFQLCWPDTAVPQEPAHATDHPVITLITLPAPVKVGFLTGRGAGFLAGGVYTGQWWMAHSSANIDHNAFKFGGPVLQTPGVRPMPTITPSLH